MTGRITYAPLFRILRNNNIDPKILMEKIGAADGTLERLYANVSVDTVVIERICNEFQCVPGDIMTMVYAVQNVERIADFRTEPTRPLFGDMVKNIGKYIKNPIQISTIYLMPMVGNDPVFEMALEPVYDPEDPEKRTAYLKHMQENKDVFETTRLQEFLNILCEKNPEFIERFGKIPVNMIYRTFIPEVIDGVRAGQNLLLFQLAMMPESPAPVNKEEAKA